MIPWGLIKESFVDSPSSKAWEMHCYGDPLLPSHLFLNVCHTRWGSQDLITEIQVNSPAQSSHEDQIECKQILRGKYSTV
jgi:hypothetical protein